MERKIRQKIELGTDGKAMLAKMFGGERAKRLPGIGVRAKQLTGCEDQGGCHCQRRPPAGD